MILIVDLKLRTAQDQITAPSAQERWDIEEVVARGYGGEYLIDSATRSAIHDVALEFGSLLVMQIQFLLGRVSVETTERYLGCKQRLSHAVNDNLGLGAT